METKEIDLLLKFLAINWDELVRDQNSELNHECVMLNPESFYNRTGPSKEIRDYVRSKGFEINAGEIDSFGWITGVINRIGHPETEYVLYG